MNTLTNHSMQVIKLDFNELYKLKLYIEHHRNIFCYNDEINIIRQWHYNEIYKKISNCYTMGVCDERKNIKVHKIKVNEIERHVLSIVFRVFDDDPIILCITEKFIKGLSPIKLMASFTNGNTNQFTIEQ